MKVDLDKRKKKVSSVQRASKPVHRARERTEIERRLLAAERLINAKVAAQDLVTFAQYTSPDKMDPEDSDQSDYKVMRHHEALAAALDEVAAGRIKRLIVSMPPRHGKSELATRKFIPWYLGKNPGKHVICAAYNDKLAQDFGIDVKETLESKAYSQVFPDFEMVKGGKSQTRIRSKSKSMAYFIGRGGSITGRGGDLIIVDDLFKNDAEADSPAMREKVWKWFTGTIMNRFMTDEGCMIIVMTRWHEDDVIGRLTDKNNPNYNEEIAAGFHTVNLPAIAEEDDLLGRKPGEALWPDRFGVKFLMEQKNLGVRRFSCLYQGNPTPEEGSFFIREHVRYYSAGKMKDKPNWRIYMTADLSVGTKQQQKGGRLSDRSVIIVFAIDDNDDIYILDATINRKRSDENVEHIVNMMLEHRPLTFFGYQDHITGSIGPFLNKRMRERRAYTRIEEWSSAGSKEQKAQAFRGRMAMGKVYFPQGKAWAADIIEELIVFPGGRNDDCVDACALIGQSMDFQISGKTPDEVESDIPPIGTLAWIKYASEQEKLRLAAEDRGGF